MTISGSVKGKVTYCDHEIEYTANVSGDYWEDKGDYWTPPSSDSEGPFFEDIDEVVVYDMEEWCEWYDKHCDKIDALIKEDVEEHKDWDDCEWNWDDLIQEPPYDEPPEEGGRYNWDPAEED